MTHKPDSTHDAAELRTRLTEVMGRDGLSQTDVAREAGISAASLSSWLQDKYGADPGNMNAKVERWLDAYAHRKAESGHLPPAPSYVETPTGSRVLDALMYAQTAGDMIVVYGGAGLGKTSALKRYAQTSPSVWVATMTPATASVVTALEEVAEALGLRDLHGGAARLQRAIVRRLRDTEGLLIIDEAQHLSVAALDQLRSLHDAAGIGLALVGNEAVYARMTGGNRAAFLDRLYSRIGKRVRIVQSVQGDVTALAQAWGVSEPDTLRLLADIAAKPGALRAVTKCLRLGHMLAAGAGETLAVRHVRAAWNDLGCEA